MTIANSLDMDSGKATSKVSKSRFAGLYRDASNGLKRWLEASAGPSVKQRTSYNVERLEARHLLAANPLITEFMADNDDNVGFGEIERDFGKPDPFEDGSTPDWIEIYNAGDEAIDLIGYHLTDSQTNLEQWTFPSKVLEPNEYMLVYATGMTEDQATEVFIDRFGNLHTNFGLGFAGEYLALVDPAGNVVSEFGKDGKDFPQQESDVSFGFSQTVQVIRTSSEASYWVPLNGNLGTSWSEPDFDADAAGFTKGTAALGYEDRPGDRTNFVGQFDTEIPSGAHGVYVRMEFDVEDASSVNSMLLRLKHDNSFVAYLNGSEVARDADAPANAGWFSTSPRNSPRDSRAIEFSDFDIAQHSNLLVNGKNALGIHLMNNLSDDSDMLLVTELFTDKPVSSAKVGYLPTPTPGAANIVFDSFAGPEIANVTQNPGQLADDQDLTVTAIVRELNAPVGEVNLHYRVMYNDEVIVPMVDDGTGVDTTAGDGIYSAMIPADASGPGEMVRWRVLSTDVNGELGRNPLFGEPDESIEYYGTIVADPEVDSSNLPILHWFIADGDQRRAETDQGAKASFFYLGEFYDNVHMDIHGQSSRGFIQKSYDLDFANGNRFKWQEGEGRVRDINLLNTWPDKGKFRNTLGYEIYRDSGSPYLFAFPVRLQQNGEFFSIYDIVEDADDRTLRRLGLNEDGALYKMYATNYAAGGAEKKTRKWEDKSDVLALNEATRLRGEEWTNYAFDNLDIPEMVNFLTAFDLTSNRDCCHKNYYVFKDTGQSEEWQLQPWDVDLSFGHNWTGDVNYFKDTMDNNNGLRVGGNNSLITKLYNARDTPGFLDMYHRRLRTLMDQFIQEPGTPYEELWLETRLDEIISLIDPNDDPFDSTPVGSARNGTVQGTDDADLYYNRWGSWEHGNGGRAHAARGETMREHIDRVKTDFSEPRREYLYSQSAVPDAQVGNPTISFGDIEVAPASGNVAEQYVTLVNNHDVAVDVSNWRLSGGIDFTLPAGTVIPSGWTLYVVADKPSFRARETGPSGGQALFIVGGWEGEMSTEGESLTLFGADNKAVGRTFIGELTDPSDVQKSLRISEINYAPHSPNLVPGLGEADVPADMYEFVELTNIGTTALDLSGVTLSASLDYTFPDGVSLAANDQILVVKNTAAFESRYGTGLNIAGEYAGDLADDGDTIFVDDGAGQPVQGISYTSSGVWPSRAAVGSSLQIINVFQGGDDGANWQASSELGGTPDGAGQPVNDSIQITEVLPGGTGADGDMIELFNTSSADVDISNWYLSNSTDNYFKYKIPAGTTISGRGYAVFNQSQLGFDLDNARGDSVFLLQADGNGRPLGFASAITFGPIIADRSVGPHDSGVVALASTTFGAANTGRHEGDLIISEIHHSALDPDGAGRLRSRDFEYIEIYNNSDAALDISGWKLEGLIDRTNEFVFLDGTTIEAGQAVPVVAFDPADPRKAATFKFTHAMDLTAPLFGATREIKVSEGLLKLLRPIVPPADDPNLEAFYVVDQVDFTSEPPWPSEPNGTGQSLTRLNSAGIGALVSSWVAADVSPGVLEQQALPTPQVPGDSNGDGIFNQQDIAAVLQGNKFNTGEPATFAQGDWNGDGVFNNLDIVTVLQAGTYSPGASLAKSPDPEAADAIFEDLDVVFRQI